jgi:D-alanine-D-alanine ligase
MKKKKIKVAVVYNEAAPEMYVKSTEHTEKVGEFKPYFEVEDLTPMEEYEILAQKLTRVGFDAYALNIKDNIQKMIDDFKNNKPDVVFNFVEIYKEDSRLEMNVVGIYELLGVAYTGAPAMALSNCQNKIMAKQLLRSLGVPIPNYFMVNEKRERYLHKLDYPLVVKPSLEDASVGIENESIVKNYKKLKERINYVLHYFEQPVLVEEFIEGRELNIAVLGDKKPKALPISEIDFAKMPEHLHNIVSYQAKWDPHHESYHKTIPKCPAKLPKKIEVRAKKIALKAFKIMGCRDYARVDMRLNKDNELKVLEVNPNPDLTDGAGFMRSAGAAGYSYAQALKRIVMLAYARKNGKFVAK